MERFINYLNINSGAVVAAASVVTAIATIVIAVFSCLSLRMLRWEKEKDRRAREPILVLADEITGNNRSLYVKNVGYGPAMDVVRNIVQAGNLVKTTPNEPLLLGSLGPGEKVYAYCATPPSNDSVPIIDDPNFRAVLEYDDILRTHYETSYH
ncbi:MAG: hypothetical protein ACE5JO_01305 [Candidatus Binatia bacterium]